MLKIAFVFTIRVSTLYVCFGELWKIFPTNGVKSSPGVVRSLSSSDEFDRRQSKHENEVSSDFVGLQINRVTVQLFYCCHLMSAGFH